MNIRFALRSLAELETAMADLYLYFSEVFAGDEELASAFVRLAGEERSHARLVDYQRRMLQQNQALAAGVEVDLSAIAETLARVKAVRQAPPPPTAAEALCAVLALESGAAEAHFKNALKAARPEIARLLDALGADDVIHAERLRAMAARRGIALQDPPAGQQA